MSLRRSRQVGPPVFSGTELEGRLGHNCWQRYAAARIANPKAKSMRICVIFCVPNRLSHIPRIFSEFLHREAKASMSAQGDNAVAQMTNWSQRVNKEIQGALDWYKEWGIVFQRENNAKPPSLDELIRQKEAELRRCA